ncbi:hypothetical protein BDP27DRAFT_1435057 [Rhodocollybia butyracea]|uniref:Uncharacterized protein n=1 Tax=Rhodocollybia butyracea TaxID=206335 RepID=A0A9P5P658_9AGAR|nr:hypothetical protein BDP27DRAFT_1435057 [Rhodocollybia butyracea]
MAKIEPNRNSADAPLEDYNGVSPRVNGLLLHQYIGLFVILPCQVVQDLGDSLSVMAPDNILVTVSLQAIDRHVVCYPFTPFLEVLGKVCKDKTTVQLLATRIHGIAASFDLSMVNRVIECIHGPFTLRDHGPTKDVIFNVNEQRYARDLKDCEESSFGR